MIIMVPESILTDLKKTSIMTSFELQHLKVNSAKLQLFLYTLLLLLGKQVYVILKEDTKSFL